MISKMSTGYSEFYTTEEVRAKLSDLGYKSVSDTQLQKFMTDLRQLVDHETSTKSFTGTERDTPSTDGRYYERDIIADGGRLPLRDTRESRTAFARSKVDHRPAMEKENFHLLPGMDLHGTLTSPTSSCTSDNMSYASFYERPSSPERLMSSARCRRKVARKKDGKTHVFDETFKENDSEASDITVLEERLQALPIKDDEDQDSFQDPEYDDADRDDDSSSETSTERNTDRSETVDRREFLHNAALPSYIRPPLTHPHTRRIRKTDPVNRYLQFKEEWKNNRVPGEDRHNALRWNVRGQMLNCDMFEKPQRNLKKNSYVVPTEKKRQALRWQVRSALART